MVRGHLKGFFVHLILSHLLVFLMPSIMNKSSHVLLFLFSLQRKNDDSSRKYKHGKNFEFHDIMCAEYAEEN